MSSSVANSMPRSASRLSPASRSSAFVSAVLFCLIPTRIYDTCRNHSWQQNVPGVAVQIPIGIPPVPNPSTDMRFLPRGRFSLQLPRAFPKLGTAPNARTGFPGGTCESTTRWDPHGESPVRSRRARRLIVQPHLRGLQPGHRDVILRGARQRHVPAVPQPNHGGVEPRLIGRTIGEGVGTRVWRCGVGGGDLLRHRGSDRVRVRAGGDRRRGAGGQRGAQGFERARRLALPAARYVPHLHRRRGDRLLMVAFGLALIIALAYAAPIMIGITSPLHLLIAGFALYEAWKLNRGVALQVAGPYPAAASPAAA